MKNFFTKLLILPIVLLTMVSCGEEKDTFVYSVSNRLQLNGSSVDNFAVMDYAEKHVKMGQASTMTFVDIKADADRAAIAEFTKRMQAVNEAEFCGLMVEGDYYEFILYRASNEPDGQEEIARRSYRGTKKK